MNREYRRGLEDGLDLFHKHIQDSKSVSLSCKRKTGIIFNEISGSIKEKKLETIEKELGYKKAL